MVTKSTNQVGMGGSIGIVVGGPGSADQGGLVDIWVVVAGLIVGFVVGLTGMGGGALMTPLLVLVFGVTPLTAVSSDLVAALVMKPVGGGLHLRRGTVHRGLVLWLALGSVPAAFAGAVILDRFAGPQLAERMKEFPGVVASSIMMLTSGGQAGDVRKAERARGCFFARRLATRHRRPDVLQVRAQSRAGQRGRGRVAAVLGLLDDEWAERDRDLSRCWCRSRRRQRLGKQRQAEIRGEQGRRQGFGYRDRKSTRLNSSHT